MKEGYKKTELGWIPEEWDVNTTGEIFEFIGGLSISREKLGEEGVNYLHYGDIHKRNENFIDLEVDEQWIPKFNEEYKNIKNGVKLETGDVVFADASEDYEGIGKSVSILNYDNKPFVAGLHTIVGKDRNNLLDEHYKRYCFSTKNIRKQFRVLATGTSVYGISRENIKKIKFLIPPLKEQQKIAEILSTVDSQIDDTDNLIEKTEELKKGLMQRLLTKGIGHNEFKMTEVGEIPVEWEVKRFSDISKINQGLQIAIEERFKEVAENRLPYITIQYINDKSNIDNQFYIDNANSSVVCYEEDILMTRTGNTGVVVTNEYGVFHNNFFKVDFNREVLIKDFLVYYLKSTQIQKLILNYAGSTTIPDLKHKDFYRIPVIIPSIEEQKHIADILISVDNEIKYYENKKTKLEEIKKGLMQQLLTGKIRVV